VNRGLRPLVAVIPPKSGLADDLTGGVRCAHCQRGDQGDAVAGLGAVCPGRAVLAPAVRHFASTVLTRPPVHNLVISNVPGPQMPWYFLGCHVKALYPPGPIFCGTGLNITVMSLTPWPTTSRSLCRNSSPPPRDPPT
jgi:hypothetical protein